MASYGWPALCSSQNRGLRPIQISRYSPGHWSHVAQLDSSPQCCIVIGWVGVHTGSGLQRWHSVYMRIRGNQVSPVFLKWPTKTKPPSQCCPHATGHSQGCPTVIVSLGMMWFRDQELSSSCWCTPKSFSWGRRGLWTLLHRIVSFMTLPLLLLYNRPPLKLNGLKLRGSKPSWFIIAYNSVDWQSEGFFCSTFNILT